MNEETRVGTECSRPLYHGTRGSLSPGQLIEPSSPGAIGDRDRRAHVFLTSDLDEAIWDGELAGGDGCSRVYVVEPYGSIQPAAGMPGWEPAGHPTMSLCTRGPLHVIAEITEWPLYHGTRADLKPGDLITTGFHSNFGERAKARYVYFTRTLDAAKWGAELSVGDRLERIYRVQPTGAIEHDPDLTNRKFRGNPTQSYRSREPLRIVGEIKAWKGHSAEVVATMKSRIAELRRIKAIED